LRSSTDVAQVAIDCECDTPAGRSIGNRVRDTMTLQRLVSWFVLGVGAAVAELGLLKVLYEFLQWPLPVATLLAAEAFVLLKFIVADRWVFNHPRPTLDRALRYHGACAGALVVYWLVINGLAVLLALAYEIAFVLGTGASFVWSLLTNFFWVWARPTRRPRREKASGIAEHQDATSAVGRHE
jgi:putative flippase GtrA